jgi:ParB-like chromosome segregation protein Spo0J
MQPGDYIELTKDIELHGLGEPVWTYEGKILDGRHRARACAELGVECPTRDTPATIQQDSS